MKAVGDYPVGFEQPLLLAFQTIKIVGEHAHRVLASKLYSTHIATEYGWVWKWKILYKFIKPVLMRLLIDKLLNLGGVILDKLIQNLLGLLTRKQCHVAVTEMIGAPTVFRIVVFI